MPMKWNLALLSVMLLSLVNVSCSKKSGDEGGVTPSMYDGWMLTSWNGDESIAGRVYLSFSDDRFTLYQQIGDLSTSGFTKYTGTCTFAGNGKLLTGVYSDGTPWRTEYVVETHTDTELRLLSVQENIESVFRAVQIPGHVKIEPLAGSSRSGVSAVPFL